jgi:cysteine desulfurase NifS
VFSSGSRVTTDFRSQHHGIPELYRDRPEPGVAIHTKDAEARGIGNGDLVRLSTPRGSVKLRARVTDDITPGTADADMGGGGPVGPKAWQDCNINELTDLDRYDPLSGFPVYKSLLCQVQKSDAAVKRVEMDSGERRVASFVDKQKERNVPAHRIYLDHNATTRPDPEVIALMDRLLAKGYGNPSSIYLEGREARSAIENARRSVAQLINATARRIAFTAGGSEANNTALKGAAFLRPGNKNHIITSKIEHPSVLAACAWLERQGLSVTYLDVDESGRVNPEDLSRGLTDRTFLVSIMTANNETGSIQPIAELAGMARARGALFHTDAVQAAGRIPVDVERLGVDFLSISGHKIQGPKGCGALYLRKDRRIEPLIHGGGQEGGFRSGTENVPAIAGMGKAAELALKNLKLADRTRSLRDRLAEGIKKAVPGARVNGAGADRLPNTLNLTLPGIRGESLVLALDQKGISLSSGSACRSGSPKPSHVLRAIGLSEEEAHCSIRLSLGPGTADLDISETIAAISSVITASRSSVRFVPCR